MPPPVDSARLVRPQRLRQFGAHNVAGWVLEEHPGRAVVIAVDLDVVPNRLSWTFLRTRRCITSPFGYLVRGSPAIRSPGSPAVTTIHIALSGDTTAPTLPLSSGVHPTGHEDLGQVPNRSHVANGLA